MVESTQSGSKLKQHTIWQDGRKPEPCNIVIFGATGDLTQRKILPTLAHLMHDHPLSESSCIVAYARRPLTNQQWRSMVVESINKYLPDDDNLDSIAQVVLTEHLINCQSNVSDG